MIIRAITKSNKKVLDKFTVYFWDGTCLSLSHNPNSPQGVTMWGEYYGINDDHYYEAAESKDHIISGTDEKMINFFELPSVVQAHIEKRIGENK